MKLNKSYDDMLEELVDIRSVVVDTNLPRNERVADFVEKIKNPNRFKYKDRIVNVKFNKYGQTLDDTMISLLLK